MIISLEGIEAPAYLLNIVVGKILSTGFSEDINLWGIILICPRH